MGEIDDDFIISAAMVPIAIVALFLAARFCRNEKTKSMAIPIVSLPSSSLFVYRLTLIDLHVRPDCQSSQDSAEVVRHKQQ